MGVADIRAGGAYVELFADNSKLVRDLRSADKTLKSWGSGLTSIGAGLFGGGAAITGVLSGAVAAFTSMGSELNDISARTGIDVNALGSLGFAAKQTGADMGAVEIGIRKMQKKVFEAETGSKSAQDALKNLGLTADELKGLTPDKQFELIAEKIAAIPDASKKAAMAIEFFGRSGTILLPMIRDLSSLQSRAKELNLGISPQDVEMADSLGDSFGELWAVTKRVTFGIGAALAPALKLVTTGLSNAASAVVKFVDKNRGIVAAVAGVGTALLATGTLAIGFGLTLSIIGTAIGSITTLLTTLGAIGAGSFAAIAGPVGIAAAAIVGAGGAFLYFSGAGAQMWQSVAPILGSLQGTVTSMMGGISNALKGNDVQLAGEIMWTGLQVVFETGKGSLLGVWYGLIDSLEVAFGISMTDLVNVADSMFSMLARKMASFSEKFTDIWVEYMILDPEQRQTAIEDRKMYYRNKQYQGGRQEWSSPESVGDRMAKRYESDKQRKSDHAAGVPTESETRLAELSKKLENMNIAAQKKAEDAANIAKGKAELGSGVAAKSVSLERKMSGTFSGFGAERMGGFGSAMDQTAKHTRDTAKYTKQIANKKDATKGVAFS